MFNSISSIVAQLFVEYMESGAEFENMKTLINKYDIKWVLLNTETEQGKLSVENKELFNVVDEGENYFFAKTWLY